MYRVKEGDHRKRETPCSPICDVVDWCSPTLGYVAITSGKDWLEKKVGGQPTRGRFRHASRPDRQRHGHTLHPFTLAPSRASRDPLHNSYHVAVDERTGRAEQHTRERARPRRRADPRDRRGGAQGSHPRRVPAPARRARAAGARAPRASARPAVAERAPQIPSEVTDYYLQRVGFDCQDARLCVRRAHACRRHER
jgi:hypothetical protein